MRLGVAAKGSAGLPRWSILGVKASIPVESVALQEHMRQGEKVMDLWLKVLRCGQREAGSRRGATPRGRVKRDFFGSKSVASKPDLRGRVEVKDGRWDRK